MLQAYRIWPGKDDCLADVNEWHDRPIKGCHHTVHCCVECSPLLVVRILEHLFTIKWRRFYSYLYLYKYCNIKVTYQHSFTITHKCNIVLCSVICCLTQFIRRLFLEELTLKIVCCLFYETIIFYFVSSRIFMAPTKYLPIDTYINR